MAWGTELFSNVHLSFKTAVSREEWLQFCDDNGLVCLPWGKNTFAGGNTGRVRACFDGCLPLIRPPMGRSESVPSAEYVSIATAFYKGDRKGVVDLTAAVCARWPALILECDFELMPFMADRCLTVLPRERPKEKCSG